MKRQLNTEQKKDLIAHLHLMMSEEGIPVLPATVQAPSPVALPPEAAVVGNPSNELTS